MSKENKLFRFGWDSGRWNYAPRGLLVNHGTLFVRRMKKGLTMEDELAA